MTCAQVADVFLPAQSSPGEFQLAHLAGRRLESCLAWHVALLLIALFSTIPAIRKTVRNHFYFAPVAISENLFSAPAIFLSVLS